MYSKRTTEVSGIGRCLLGPAPFPIPDDTEQCPKFIGRERESRDLVDLISANSELLLYSQPGSGKTSLLNAGIIPKLKDLGFQVFPPMRVAMPLRADASLEKIANIYVYNALSSIIDDKNYRELSGESFCDFFESQVDGNALGTVLIIDQLEEILDHLPNREQERKNFFQQLALCLKRHKPLRVVFSINEERIAAMEQYFRLLPERVATRAHLENLGEAQAKQVLLRSWNCAAEVVPPFEPEAAKYLYATLTRTNVVSVYGEQETVSKAAVSPLLLQVSCSMIMARLQPGGGDISIEDVRAYASSDTVLMDFYEECLKQTRRNHPGENLEFTLRQWFEQNLVNEYLVRQGVACDGNEVAGLNVQLLDEMVRLRLLSRQQRQGFVWYELTHPSLAKAIKFANERWYEQNAPFSQLKRKLDAQAHRWLASNRSNDRLLQEKELSTAEHWLGSVYGKGLAADDPIRGLVTASQKQKERKRIRRRWTITAGIILLLMGWSAAFVMKNVIEIRGAAGLANKSLEELEVRPYQSLRGAYRAVRTLEAVGVVIKKLPRVSSNWTKAHRIAWQALDSAVIQSRLKVRLETDGSGRQSSCGVWGITFGGEDKELIASGHGDGRVRLWDGVNGRLEHTLQHSDQDENGHCAYAVVAVAFNTDGSRLATIGKDGTVSLWCITGCGVTPPVQALWKIGAFKAVDQGADQGAGFDIAFSPDGKRLAAAGADIGDRGPVGYVRFFAADSGILLRNVAADSDWLNHEGMVFGIDFGPSGRWVATASADKTVKIWDPDTHEVETLFGHNGLVYSVAFSEDGTRLATGSADRTARIWRLDEGIREAKQLPHRDILGGGIAFSPDGNRLVTVSADNTARLWDVETGKLLRVFSGHTAALYGVAFSADGGRIVTGGEDGTARIWAVHDPNELVAHTDKILDIAFGRGDTCSDYLVAVSADTTLSLWNTSEGRLLKRVSVPGEGSELTSVSMNDTCTWIAAASTSGAVFLTKREPESPLLDFDPGIGRINAIWLLDDGDNRGPLLFMGGADGVVQARRIVDKNGRTEMLWMSNPLPGAVNDLVIMDRGRKLLAVITNPVETFWEANIDRGVTKVRFESAEKCEQRGISRSIAVTPNGSLVALLGNKAVVLDPKSDADSCKPFSELPGFLLDIAADPSPNRRQFAVASTSGTVRIGNIETSSWGKSLSGYRFPVNSISYSEDGRLLATGSADGKIRLHLLDPEELKQRAEKKLEK